MFDYDEVMESFKSVPSITEHLNSSQVTLGKEIMKRRMELGLSRDMLIEKCNSKGLSLTQSVLSDMELGLRSIEVVIYKNIIEILDDIER